MEDKGGLMNLRNSRIPGFPLWSPRLQVTHCQGSEEPVAASEERTCDTCLYTGVATCACLSAYFFKLAYLDIVEAKTPELSRQRRFLALMGTASAVGGIYRWYLG